MLNISYTMRKPEQVGKSHDYSSHHQPHSTCRKGVVKKDEKKEIKNKYYNREENNFFW